jgi:hypothetical protein
MDDGRIPIPPRTSVAQSLLALFMRLWWLKAVGTTFFLCAFFYLYFRIQSTPHFAVVDVPLTWLDRAIPMQAWAWVPYLSLWIYTSLPPAFQPDLRSLVYYGVCIFSVCATGLLCFYLWPTSVSGLFKPAGEVLSWLKGIDLAGNACPSLHVASAVFSWAWLRHQLLQLGAGRNWHLLSLLWGATIVFSTLLTKQHAGWDVLSGALLGAIGAGISLYALHLSAVSIFLGQSVRVPRVRAPR